MEKISCSIEQSVTYNVLMMFFKGGRMNKWKSIIVKGAVNYSMRAEGVLFAEKWLY
jgi:hypothetical protein